MIRNVTIISQSELEETWTDPRCPNMGWNFIERDIENCLQEDDTYVATYQTFEVPVGETFSSTYLTNSGDTTYILQAGEYGIKP